MDATKPKSAIKNKTKLARTFQKVINLRNATRIASNNGICILTTQGKDREDDSGLVMCDGRFHCFDKSEEAKARNRAVMEALAAKLFASITSIKAGYAELQMAQNPYCSEAIQAADQAVVDELKAISELKRSFLKKELDLSPQVTLMLSEIQEQQSLMKTYEITIKKLETESELKDSDIASFKKKLDESVAFNKSLEKKLNTSGPLTVFDNLRFPRLNPSHFVQFLHHTLKSIRSFVKLMIREMDAARWDLDAAVKSIESDAVFAESSHRSFVFEAFVSKTMFEGFNDPSFFAQTESAPLTKRRHHQHRHLFFDKFREIISANPKLFLSQNSNAPLAKFTRAKYLHVVHAKMECSFFGNLNRRKIVNSGGVPDSPFFASFAEMSKRVWLLHCLAFSLHEQMAVFQVRKSCRFSELYMESVAEETVHPAKTNYAGTGADRELRVAFTVVPGFKIGETVIQSQVYLEPSSY